jgi:two-component system sensor histidine kinase RegB
MEKSPGSDLDDVRLIRAEVARCRLILDQMAAGVGKSAEQAVETISLQALLDESVAGVRPAPPVELDLDGTPGSTPVRLPPHAVAQALRGLVTNAQDASTAGHPVRLVAGIAHRALTVQVIDRGPGMAPEVLDRIGEPFFTTKAPGHGMGLGLFLARAVVERLGGSLEVDSQPEVGTRVRVTIPAEVVASPAVPTAEPTPQP